VPTQEHLMTQQQVASYLGLSEKEVGKLLSTPGYSIEDELPHLQIGNKKYFNKTAVTQWIQKQQVGVCLKAYITDEKRHKYSTGAFL
jgi:hypothetical protein